MHLSRKSPPLRVLCYAVNGLGLGHLTRLISISRELRRMAWLLDLPVEICFLTTSEGDSLAALHDFPSFKIPSRTVATNGGLAPGRFRKLAKQWVWNAFGLFAPDLFLVDTFPSGVFDELMDVLDFGQRNAFVYRAVRPAQANSGVFQSALRAYDLIIKPGEGGVIGNDSPVPDEMAHKVLPTGTILVRSRTEMFSPEEARENLGLPREGTCVYVSVGGGGDHDAEAHYRTLSEVATRFPEVRFVFGAGSLYMGREWHQPNVSWTRRPLMAVCLHAFDAAICAGGYNSVAELLHAGIPCVFLPQPRSHDDQEARVARCVAQGAGILPGENTVGGIGDALMGLFLPGRAAAASEAARELVPDNDASLAARECLALLIEREHVECAADLRDEFVAQGARLPPSWREQEYLLALGMIALSDAGEDTDEEPGEAIRATWTRCEASNKAGQTPRHAVTALRQTRKELHP